MREVRLPTQFPRAGRKVPEYDDEDVREVIVYSDRVIYRLTDNDIVIAAIIHGKRMLP